MIIMIVIFWKGKVWKWLAKLLDYEKKTYTMMDDYDYNKKHLDDSEYIIVSPGIAPHHKIYKTYPHKIISELNYIGNFLNTIKKRDHVVLFGITATDGKSTTTRITYHLLQHIFWSTQRVSISWNFDIPLSETIVDECQKNIWSRENPTLIVVETSSFMLYQLNTLWFDYSCRMNISPDHLNRHSNFEDYYQTKKRIIEQTINKSFVSDKIYKKYGPFPYHTHITQPISDITTTNFSWDHNKYNCWFALDLVNSYCATKNKNTITIKHDWRKNILPLKHRISFITTKNWIDFYDDSKSTSSQSLKAALSSFEKEVIIIAWWVDKWDTFWHLWTIYKKKCIAGVFIWTTKKQFGEIFENNNIPFVYAENMTEAVTNAYNIAKEYIKNKSDKISTNHVTILLSPWCASFDMFKDYEDRAHHFIEAIHKLEE